MADPKYHSPLVITILSADGKVIALARDLTFVAAKEYPDAYVLPERTEPYVAKVVEYRECVPTLQWVEDESGEYYAVDLEPEPTIIKQVISLSDPRLDQDVVKKFLDGVLEGLKESGLVKANQDIRVELDPDNTVTVTWVSKFPGLYEKFLLASKPKA
jgi:hypothetical protein